MSKMDRKQSILNWLESEKQKDNREVENTKQKYIREIKSISKEEMFPIPKKLTLWQRIKMILTQS